MSLITAANQQISGNSAVISTVSMPGPGTLAIFASDAAGGLAFPPIGFVSLQQGEYRDIIVTLTTQPKSGDKLFAVLEKPGSYVDPYMENDKPVDTSFQVL